MKPSANLLEFGEALTKEMATITAELPVGVGIDLVSDQPRVVEEAVGGFTKALAEAIGIVLVVSFISLGMRAGFIVALSIPLVLAITFVAMQYFGISLQRISLGALIIGARPSRRRRHDRGRDDGLAAGGRRSAGEGGDLRLHVDGLSHADGHARHGGKLHSVGLNTSGAGEFTFTLFVVIAVSLVVSWIVAVVFTPLLGVTFLPKTMKKHHDRPGWFTRPSVSFSTSASASNG